MKSNSRLVVLLVTLILCLAPLTSIAASTVRGRLIRGGYPAQGIAVTVFNQQLGRSNAAYSGPDGMYYLYNIPPGYYTLEVWVGNPPMTFQIVVAEGGYTDIAQIQVP